MAWTSTTISGDEWTAHQADKPCLVGTHCILDSLSGDATGGVWNQTGDLADPDETATGYPTTRAFDGFAQPGLATAPDAVQTTWYLGFDLSSSPVEFDTIAIIGAEGPTAVSLDDADLVQVDISDSADFATRLETPLTLVTADPYTVGSGPLTLRNFNTLLTHDFPDPKRYSGVAYLRVKISHAAGLMQPLITEVWLGRRRQLLFHPDLPLDDHHELTAMAGAGRSRVGINAPYLRHRGAARRTIVSAIDTTTNDDQLDAIEDWWVDSEYGTRSFLWIENPYTAPEGYIMNWDGDAIDYDPRLVGPTHRQVEIPMAECDPLRSQS